jgi:hypothetical protein
MTKEYEEIIERFDRIKKAAWDMEPIPEGFDFACDIRCYQDLCALFSGHRILKSVSKEELFKKGGDYKNAYITEYKHTVLQAEIYKEDHERRMRASQAEAKLIKEDLELKEIYKTLFFDLLPKVIPPQSAEKIFESIGVKMWSLGGLDNTAENREIIRKIITEEENAVN